LSFREGTIEYKIKRMSMELKQETIKEGKNKGKEMKGRKF
jgi:hypothetical protein